LYILSISIQEIKQSLRNYFFGLPKVLYYSKTLERKQRGGSHGGNPWEKPLKHPFYSINLLKLTWQYSKVLQGVPHW
jgi:hypothetical protein